MHTLVIGATGSGKTAGIINPTMKMLMKARESIVITDPKGEIYEDNYKILKELGYQIIVLNFREPQKGSCWNPYDLPYKFQQEGNFDKANELLNDKEMQELAKENLNCEFIGGGSVQEEVGCRGAKALAVNIKPSIAFSLDTSPESSQTGFECGKGPQLFVMDSSTIGNKKLLTFVKEIAKKHNIPHQIGLLNRGGTDLSELQNAGGGCPSLAIGIPVRNIHSPVGIINYNDYLNTINLMVEVIENITTETVAKLKASKYE